MVTEQRIQASSLSGPPFWPVVGLKIWIHLIYLGKCECLPHTRHWVTARHWGIVTRRTVHANSCCRET